jgi:hypothetical protein
MQIKLRLKVNAIKRSQPLMISFRITSPQGDARIERIASYETLLTSICGHEELEAAARQFLHLWVI